MVFALWNVFRWCQENNRHEFTKKDIKHLLEKDVISANFAYWRWFGGLLYNPDGIQGHYGMNMDRCRKFFAGELTIPTVLYKNPLAPKHEQITPDEYKKIHEIPQLKDFLDANEEYLVVYRGESEFEDTGQGKLL